MAVKKSDLEGKLTAAQKKAVTAFEKRTDAKLTKEWQKGEVVQVDFPKSGLDEKVQEEIVRLFRAQGWKVSFDSSQRDDRQWLEFS